LRERRGDQNMHDQWEENNYKNSNILTIAFQILGNLILQWWEQFMEDDTTLIQCWSYKVFLCIDRKRNRINNVDIGMNNLLSDLISQD